MSDEKLAPSLITGGVPAPIVPRSFDDVYRLARVLSASQMVPDSYRGEAKEADCAVAIMQGLEIGLSPIAAVNSIAVVNGRPSLWGDGALAVVRASGHLEYIKEWLDEETNTATCEVKRKGDPEPVVRTFSEADAKTASLWGKKGPWQTYPGRMLQMRSRSWALRDVFADVMKGLSVAEEVRDIDITPKDYKEVPEISDIPDLPEISDEPENEPLADEDGFLEKLKEEMSLAGDDPVVQQEVWDGNAHLIARLSPKNKSKVEALQPVTEAA